MFNIYEYYSDEVLTASFSSGFARETVEDIESDIRSDIDQIFANPLQGLYLTERYKFGSGGVEILYPALGCPERHSLMLTPDKLRFSLSVHSSREELRAIERILIRPRYVKMHDAELTALYLWDRAALILYLTYPNSARTANRDLVARGRARELHPISGYISVIASGAANALSKASRMEKFFLKRNGRSRETVKALENISDFYSRHGY